MHQTLTCAVINCMTNNGITNGRMLFEGDMYFRSIENIYFDRTGVSVCENSTTGVTKGVVCVILSVGWYI